MDNFLFNSLSKGINSRQFMSALGEMQAMALQKPFWPLAKAQVAKVRLLRSPQSIYLAGHLVRKTKSEAFLGRAVYGTFMV